MKKNRLTINQMKWLVNEEPFDEDILKKFRPILKRSETEKLKEFRIKKLFLAQINENESYFIKEYKNERLFDRIRYIFKKTKSEKEFLLGQKARDTGLSCVAPTAASTNRLMKSNYLITKKIENSKSLDKILLDRSEQIPLKERKFLIYRYGRFARKIHDSGIYQSDFDPNNVIVKLPEKGLRWSGKNPPSLYLIDFERVKIKKNISLKDRIWLLAKMNRIKGIEQKDRLRFLKGYVGDNFEIDLKTLAIKIDEEYGTVQNRDLRRMGKNCMTENRNFGIISDKKFRGYFRKKFPEVVDRDLSLSDVDEFIKKITSITEPNSDLKSKIEVETNDGTFSVAVKKYTSSFWTSFLKGMRSEWKRLNKLMKARSAEVYPLALLEKKGALKNVSFIFTIPKVGKLE